LNATTGFQIVTFVGNGVLGRAINHSLGGVPEFMIVSDYTTGSAKAVYHVGVGPTGGLSLDSTAGTLTSNRYWNNTAPTATQFTVGDFAEVNANGKNIIAYVWKSVPGYSSFGTYAGNSSTDGPCIYTGFKPAFVMVKSTTGAPGRVWPIIDNARNPYNSGSEVELHANDTNSEATNGTGSFMDLLSNGFKIRFAGASYNATGETYVYAAFAENPFGGSNVAPVTAR
jgi:hypothetical protein